MNIDIKNFVRSQSFKGILVGVLVTVVILLVFQAGVFVGYRKAAFAYHFGDSYYRVFDGRADKGPFDIHMRSFGEAHGAAGKIVDVTLPTFVVTGPDNVEKVVHVQGTTLIRRFDTDAAPEDLKAGDFVVVLGDPNDNAQIEAKLIRIMPPPPEMGTTTHN